MKVLGLAALLALVVVGMAPCQNELAHRDGTTEFTSRGNAGASSGEFLQRLPTDQLLGATSIVSFAVTLQDQTLATPETFSVVVRQDDPLLPGQPDMSTTGLLATIGPITVTFPGAGPISAAIYILTPTAPIPVPFLQSTGAPQNDLYVGVSTGPAATWTTDGLSMHISAAIGNPPTNTLGEQQSFVTVGYSGAPGISGLGWNVNTTTNQIVLGTGNRSWAINTRLADDVLQPFASNAAVFTSSPPTPNGTGTGANPNFGYAGIFPDMQRAGGPDGIGFRCRATAAIGSTCMLFLTVGVPFLPTAAPFPGVGLLVIDPTLTFPFGPLTPFLAIPTVAATGGQPATTSEATFGPFPGDVSLVGFVATGQCLTIDAVLVAGRLSTIGSIHF